MMLFDLSLFLLVQCIASQILDGSKYYLGSVAGLLYVILFQVIFFNLQKSYFVFVYIIR